MSAAPTSASAVDLVTQADDAGHWPSVFRMRGRVFRIVPGGPSMTDARGITLRVWNAAGRQVDVLVGHGARVEVLEY
jgi:hypothetical protein